MYADIVFPLKLKPLTYRLPDGVPSDIKGRIVSAPLGRRACFGVVIDAKSSLAGCSGKEVREVREIYGHFASGPGLSFLKWLADYYLAPQGVVLKSAFFEETVKAVVNRKAEVRSQKSEDRRQKAEVRGQNTEGETLNAEDAALVLRSIKSKTYKTFLYQAASLSDEISRLAEILDRSRDDMEGTILLVPEIGQIAKISPVLSEIFGGRLCVLHGRLTKKKRLETIERIVGGETDVIVGTRLAVLAPLGRVSFIGVIGEHDRSYKGEESPRYNGRDAAVMRGFKEKASVFLSSISPSVESIYNSMTGKYTRIAGSAQNVPMAGGPGRPKIRVVDMRGAGKKSAVISAEVLKEAGEALRANRKLLFLVNRKGYSLVKCEDCGHVVSCDKCGVPLVFSKADETVTCNYCGRSERVPEGCKECGGFHVRAFGAGTERIREEVCKIPGAGAVVMEKCRKGRGTKDHATDEETASFVVGTDYATRRIREGGVCEVVLLNMDSIMSQPDFRAYERAFQEVVRISQLVQADGSLLIQTWDSKNIVLKFIRNYDFEGFYRNELNQRKTLSYPPYSKIVLFNILADTPAGNGEDLVKRITRSAPSAAEGLELLGPVEMPCPSVAAGRCLQLLMKGDKRLVHDAARDFLVKMEAVKGLRINVDVDPLKI